jgi:hypothetical protein
LTDTDTTLRSVYIWIGEGTWRATVDAALSLAPAEARFTLLHLTSSAAADAAHGAYRGLLVWLEATPDVGTIPRRHITRTTASNSTSTIG